MSGQEAYAEQERQKRYLARKNYTENEERRAYSASPIIHTFTGMEARNISAFRSFL